MSEQPVSVEDLRMVYESLGVDSSTLGPSGREHLEWCEQRALEYVDHGDLAGALASMTSDLNKHPETAGHPGIMLTGMLAMNGHLSTADDVRRHIEGFN